VTPAALATSSATGVEVEPAPEDVARALDLEGVHNVRDLGGLRGARGIIPPGRFLRAATLTHATSADRDALFARGVRHDIDLRTLFERAEASDTISHDSRFHYEHISLFGADIADWLHATSLHFLYDDALAHHQGSFRHVFHVLATQQDGGVLFHCTSGKDRTGLVTALVLDLAGVDRRTIVRDYAISSHYLRRTLDPDTRSQGTSSPPSAIEHFLDAVDTRYGGTYAYLLQTGLPEAEIQELLARLGQTFRGDPLSYRSHRPDTIARE
jgi:protein-tyrosine phosphatase